ncbi:MAG: S8 family serine peptidase [Verrucomicrobiales bacterium]
MEALTPRAAYSIEVNSGLLDKTGAPVATFRSSFVTGGASRANIQAGGFRFTKTQIDEEPEPTADYTWHYEFTGGQTIYTNAFRYLDGKWPGNPAYDKYDSLAHFAVAKNVRTVGAATISGSRWTSPASVTIASYSSRGPTDDGRIKPDVVASGLIQNTPGAASDSATSGLGGTSSATPEVAGALTLVAQAWKTLHPERPEIRAETLKALAIHTASECGPAPGPDYTYGWGLVNAEAAAIAIAQDAASACHALIKETTLPNGSSVTFPVTASGQQPLKVSLCWLDPAHSILPAADNPATPHLVNDLDLTVTRTGQPPHYPFRLTRATPTAPPLTDGPNHRDTVEQVLVNSPVPGATYQVTVTPTGALVNQNSVSASQKLTLVITGIVIVPGPEFRVTVFTQTDTFTYTMGWPATVGCVYRIQTSTDFQSWADLSGDLPANQTFMATDIDVDPSEPQRFYRVKLVE